MRCDQTADDRNAERILAMKQTELIEMSVATDRERTDLKYGRTFVETLISIDARLAPEEVGSSQTKLDKKRFEGIDSINEYWGTTSLVPTPNGVLDVPNPFMLFRDSELNYWSSTYFSSRNINNRLFMGAISLSSEFDRCVNWLHLFKKTCSLQEASCGVLHLLTEPEFWDASPLLPGSSRYFGPLGGYTHERGIPNIAWATFLGRSYSKLVDAKLLTQSGYHVEEFLDGYLILMSNDISDVLIDFPTFSHRRAALKKLFPEDLFVIKNEPDSTQ